MSKLLVSSRTVRRSNRDRNPFAGRPLVPGYFVLAREALDHPALAADGVLCRRAAFVWLVEHASFAARAFNIQGRTVSLARGQLAASLRFLAKAWGWSEPGVRRFISRLKTDALIDAATDAGVTIVTICGYEEMQAMAAQADAPSDAATDARATQDRRRSDAKQNKGNEGKEGNEGQSKSSSRRSGTVDPETIAAFEEWWQAYPRKVGKPIARKAYGAALRKASAGELLTAARAFAAARAGEDPTYTPHPTTWLRHERWNDQPERRQAPRRGTAQERAQAAMGHPPKPRYERVQCAPAPILAGVLGSRDWPAVRPLVGVTETPILRPDGTVAAPRRDRSEYDWPTG